jgi:hypothetical protein
VDLMSKVRIGSKMDFKGGFFPKSKGRKNRGRWNGDVTDSMPMDESLVQPKKDWIGSAKDYL